MNDPDDLQDDLRDLFHEAVDGVHPRDGLDEIRSGARRGRWLPPTLVAAAAAVVLLGGAAFLTQHHPGRDDSAGPATSSGATDNAVPAPGITERAVPVYYVGDTARGPRLFREFHRDQVCADQDCRLKASVTSAIGDRPDDPDYRMPWPTGTGVSQLSYADGTVTIGLAGAPRDRPAGMSAAEAHAAVQQLVYSAQAGLGQGRVPVRLLLDGKPADQVLGTPVGDPVARDSMDTVLAPVWIETPDGGARVPGTFHVTGVAASFEANVVWQLRQGARVVRHGVTTAAECCTRAPYSFTVRDAPPGTYTLLVRDDDPSGNGATHVSPDTKTVVVH